MTIVRFPLMLASTGRLILLFFVATFVAPIASWAADDNPPTLLGDAASYSGFKYGFEGFQTPTHKFLQQATTTTNSSGGTKTATTTVDPKTGARSTHTTGTATSYGGSWTIQSDTSRQRSGTSGNNSSTDTTTSSNEHTTDQLKSDVETSVPPFDGNFAEELDTAAISLSPDELSYAVRKLQYKWTVQTAANDAVFWDVVFTPANTGDSVHDQHGWATGGQTESTVYTVDPTALNDKAAGVYTVDLQPNDIVQIDAFIPQEYVTAPLNPGYVYNGNNRKDPLDASLNTGTAIYGREGDFKLRHRQSVTVLAQADPGNFIESSTAKAKCGETRMYRSDQVVNGHIPANAQPVAAQTATPFALPAVISHPAEGIVTITIDDQASDPLATGSGNAPVHCQATITIDRSVPGNPTYHVTGTHCLFPAYEVYINGHRVHEYSPIPGGYGPWALILFTKTFDNQGFL